MRTHQYSHSFDSLLVLVRKIRPLVVGVLIIATGCVSTTSSPSVKDEAGMDSYLEIAGLSRGNKSSDDSSRPVEQASFEDPISENDSNRRAFFEEAERLDFHPEDFPLDPSHRKFEMEFNSPEHVPSAAKTGEETDRSSRTNSVSNAKQANFERHSETLTPQRMPPPPIPTGPTSRRNPESVDNFQELENATPQESESNLEKDPATSTAAAGTAVESSPPTAAELAAAGGPMLMPNGNYTPISLDEAIRIALENSEIIRGLGGSVLRAPEALRSSYDPAITHSDPLFGEQAALSQFDARITGSLFFEKNDREVNNQFLGTNGTILQDLGSIRTGVEKQTAYGTRFSLRSIADYDFNNAIGNRFGNPSGSWSQMIEGEARQPLLRGLGAGINGIAGPNASIGEFNGIRVAMLRTDVSVAQFRLAVRDLVSNVENAYWDLYYAYRDLEAKKAARDNALKSWQVIKTLSNAKKEGGEADKEGQAREQYFRFEADVQDAMFGRKTDATRTGNGSTGGTFRPTPGVRVAERRLRRILGLPINGNELLITGDEPLVMSYDFDWNSVMGDAESLRSELRIQNRKIEQLNLQLLAAKNMALPQLDVIGRYRFRGFGKDWVGSSPTFPTGAWDDLMDGEHQEWQAGFELNMPVGFRQAYSAIHNINQKLTRERQIMHEQRQQIVNDVSDAIQDLGRAFRVYELQYNRLQGALDQLRAVEKTNALKKAPINLVLEAQRRVLDSQTQLFRSKIEYVLALRNVHLEKGTLLNYKQIVFAGTGDPVVAR